MTFCHSQLFYDHQNTVKDGAFGEGCEQSVGVRRAGTGGIHEARAVEDFLCVLH